MVTVYDPSITADGRYISGIDYAQAHIPGNYPTALFIIPWCPASETEFAKMVRKAGVMSEKWGVFRTSLRFAAGLRVHSWSGLRAFEQDGMDIIGVNTHPALQRCADVLPPFSWVIRAYGGVPMDRWSPLVEAEKTLNASIYDREDLVLIDCKKTAKSFNETYASDFYGR
jgi:hypothetical protein